MFLSRDSLPTSSANWVERNEKTHKNLVKRTKQLKRANRKLANQIAERRRVEEALRQAEQKYRNIFENAVEGIFQTTPDGQYKDCNPALARLYGYESPAQLLANLTDIERQLYVEPHRRYEFIERLRSCDAVSEFESQVYRQDGRIIWISENARAVRDENGTLLYYEGFVTDITQRKLVEASLRKSEAQLRVKAKELECALSELQHTQAQLIQNEKMSNLGQLVAGVAHEIKNPVNFVCNNLIPASQYAEDLLKLLKLYAKHYPRPVPEVQQEAEAIDLDFLIEDFPKTLSSMQIGADRIREIVQSLQSFSRSDEAQTTSVDLHEVIDNTLLILQNQLKPRGDNPGITVIKEYGDLPLVEGYFSLLSQVFMNLLCNAIDALEEGYQKQCLTNDGEDSSKHEACEESTAQTLVNVVQPASSNAVSLVGRSPSCCNSVSYCTQVVPFVQQSISRVAPNEQANRSVAQDSGCAPDSLPLRYHSRASTADLGNSLQDKELPLVDSVKPPRTILIQTEVRANNSLPYPSENGKGFSAIASCCTTNVERQGLHQTGTPTGNGNVCAEQHSSASGSVSWAVVRIIDNGLGMAEDVRAQIFDTFFTTKPLGKGTGLGLSICYQIVVEKHGGRLRCFSQPNRGTEFVLELPIR
jgi:PAS domain S-box-containing protein